MTPPARYKRDTSPFEWGGESVRYWHLLVALPAHARGGELEVGVIAVVVGEGIHGGPLSLIGPARRRIHCGGIVHHALLRRGVTANIEVGVLGLLGNAGFFPAGGRGAGGKGEQQGERQDDQRNGAHRGDLTPVPWGSTPVRNPCCACRRRSPPSRRRRAGCPGCPTNRPSCCGGRTSPAARPRDRT